MVLLTSVVCFFIFFFFHSQIKFESEFKSDLLAFRFVRVYFVHFSVSFFFFVYVSFGFSVLLKGILV